ncbi:MAG: hypothetical protein H7Y22_04425 [Gemmatimonadaceae bacterium]|nr:hypothetical protein [Gloeobacterales cyanobacterium ES-bin-141]
MAYRKPEQTKTIRELIRETVVELCSEDDYGSWELWGTVLARLNESDQKDRLMVVQNLTAAQIRADLGLNPMNEFVDVVQNLVDREVITAKRRSHTSNELEQVPFSPEQLRHEIEQACEPRPDSFYWFG